MPFRGDDRLVDFVLSILVNGGYLKIWVDPSFAGRRSFPGIPLSAHR
jgi:ADP-glucose pyrophosphorylase